MNEILRPSGQWVLLTGLDILDPDGWDRQNFNQSWTEPISRDEFMRRASESTIDMRRWRELKEGDQP
jgi:hypothetical protein